MARTTEHHDLELGLLRTFLAVVRHGSTGKAAAALGKTQPAVSARILLLENTAGHKLFSRSRFGLKLTREGELLMPYANRAIEIAEEALVRLRVATTDSVRLGVSDETVLTIFAPAFKHLQKTYPDAGLRLTIAGLAELEHDLKQGELDLIVGNPRDIVGQPVFEWKPQFGWFARADLCVDPAHPLPLVLSRQTTPLRDKTLELLQLSGWKYHIVLEEASLDTAMAVVESGLAVAPLLRQSVRHNFICEITHTELPILPAVSMGLFQTKRVLTQTQSLMLNALTAWLKSAVHEPITRSSESHVWLSQGDTETANAAVS